MSVAPLPRIAAVIPGEDSDFDVQVADFARRQNANGWRIHGLVQQMTDCHIHCEITLISLYDGQKFPITQNLGSGSLACRLNPEAMTEAGAVFRQIDPQAVDLVIFNRFGKLESEGQGFAAEMLDLMSQDIPTLTIVPEKYLESWRNFTGGLSVELNAEPAALEAWFLAIAPEDKGQES